MKKSIVLIAFLSILSAGTLLAQGNLLQNGGFETDTLGLLSFWQTDAFNNTDETRRVFTVESPAHAGKRCVSIVNLAPNDTRVVQWIAVDPDSWYRISCWVMAENVAGGKIGANVSILGSITPSADAKDTADKWVKLELTGKTGRGQTALAISLRLGFYDNLVTGRAYFDDAAVEKMKAPPAGVKVVDFGSNRGTGMVTYTTENQTVAAAPTLSPEIMLILVMAAVGLFIVTFIMGWLKSLNKFAIPRSVGGKPKGRRAAPAAVSGRKADIPEMRRAHRKSLRINITVKKPLKGEDFKLIELKSVNVSETGLFLHSDDLSLFGVNEKLELAATYKRTRYDLGSARVVRKQETHRGKEKSSASGFGLEFVESSTAQNNSLKKLLA